MSAIFGTEGADSLTGTDEADRIFGLGGNDRVEGRGGDDLVLGAKGNDFIFGDSGPFDPTRPPPPVGDDTLLGGAGNDTIFAVGPGAIRAEPDARDLILGGLGNDSLSGADDSRITLIGGAGDDFLVGGSLDLGGSGNDQIAGTHGADTLLGGEGDDFINGFGFVIPPPFRAFPEVIRNEQADLLLGGAGNDFILGGGGNDTIQGGPGNDALAGEFGADLLTGGPGADFFRFAPIPVPLDGVVPDTGVGEGNRHLVRDFEQGSDKLGFRSYDDPGLFSMHVSSFPEPVFLGGGEFNDSLGLQVRTEILEDGRTLVQFVAPRPFATGPSTPEGPSGEVELRGAIHLTADDFLLNGP